MCFLTWFQILTKYQSYYLLFFLVFHILFPIEFIFKWAVMIRFGFLLSISFNASFLAPLQGKFHSNNLWQVRPTFQYF